MTTYGNANGKINNICWIFQGHPCLVRGGYPSPKLNLINTVTLWPNHGQILAQKLKLQKQKISQSPANTARFSCQKVKQSEESYSAHEPDMSKKQWAFYNTWDASNRNEDGNIPHQKWKYVATLWAMEHT